MLLKLNNLIVRIGTKILQYYKRKKIQLIYRNILINEKTYIGRCVEITALKGAIIDIRGVWIKEYVYIYADFNAKLIIGQNTQVGRFNTIVAKEEIIIGSNTLLAEFVTIRDQDHDLTNLNKFTTKPVKIGCDVWISNKVTVVKGVEIGNKSVIGANSVVTKDIDSNSLAVGMPAKVIRLLS